MTWTDPSLLLTGAFVAIVGAVLGMLALGLVRAQQPRPWAVVVAVAIWMGFTAALAGSGVLVRGLPTSLFPFMGASMLAAVALAFSSVGTRLASLPLVALVGFQGFRLPLEVVLHRLHGEGVIPVTMTWSGRNLDVIAGALALAAIPALRSEAMKRWHRPVAMAFNLLGLTLLLNVMVTAVLSSPVPVRRFFADPPLQLAFHVPWVWIVPICVAGALCCHLILFRALARPSP